MYKKGDKISLKSSLVWYTFRHPPSICTRSTAGSHLHDSAGDVNPDATVCHPATADATNGTSAAAHEPSPSSDDQCTTSGPSQRLTTSGPSTVKHFYRALGGILAPRVSNERHCLRYLCSSLATSSVAFNNISHRDMQRESEKSFKSM
jgi:hypothetical protein